MNLDIQHIRARKEFKHERASKLEKQMRVTLKMGCDGAAENGAPKTSPGEVMFAIAMLSSSLAGAVLDEKVKGNFFEDVSNQSQQFSDFMLGLPRWMLLREFCAVTLAAANRMLELEAKE